MRTGLPEAEWDWGSPTFKALGQHKVELVAKALVWNLEIVITDCDALVLREPFAYMARWPDAGYLTTSDCLGNTTGSNDGGLEDHGCLSSAMNIGYMYFNVSAKPMVDAWLQALRRNPRGSWDQQTFNTLARVGLSTNANGLSDRRLFRSFGGRVVGGILPLALFAGGHNHFVSRMAWRKGVEPYSVHTTFQYGGAPGKRHRLREAMLWADPPAYYAPRAGVLSYEPHIPAEMLAAGPTPRAHVAIMLHQLRQLRAALVLASTLGRRLVLPRLTCLMDKYWAPLSRSGVIPGAHAWAMPLTACPLDHMLNPAELRPSTSAHVREYSFLSNPRLPPSFAASRNSTVVDPRGGGAEAQRLRAYRSSRVLHVTNLPEIADEIWLMQPPPRAKASAAASEEPQGLISDAEWRVFRSTFAKLQGGWCCAPRGLKPNAAGFHTLHASPRPGEKPGAPKRGRGRSGRGRGRMPALHLA